MSGTYILYARSKQEFTVADELRLMGCDVWCGRVIRWKRTGKKRRPEPHEEVALPNYLWATMTAEQFQDSKRIKYLASTRQLVTHSQERGLRRFQRMVDEAYEKADEQRRRAEAPLPEFNVDQALTIIGGPFKDMVVKFRGIINAADALNREIEADGPFGKVRIDPLDVRAAE